MPSYEELIDNPYSREVDFLDLENDIEDPDEACLPNIERSINMAINKKPINEQIKPEPVKVESETIESCDPVIDFFDEKSNDIDGLKLMHYLGRLGVSKIVDGESTSYVHVQNNLVENITEDQIIDILMRQLEGEEKIRSVAHRDISKLFTSKKLRSIPERSVTTLRDDKDKAFLPYQNGLLEITKDGHELIKYQDLDTLIWKHQVIGRNFRKERGGDFELFVKNSSSYKEGGHYKLNQSEYEKKINAIGYLLHTYKDPAVKKCVILTDASLLLEDHNMYQVNGQTGKSSLFCEGLSKLRNLLSYDGKLTSIGGDKFAFQNIKLDHQLILFDDVSEKFKFKNLFHMVTGSMTVEGKNKTKYSIPFSTAPKIIITTNHPLERNGEGGESYIARQHVVEFSDFYSTKRTPLMVHGKRFFDDWDETEWARFDTFMAGCLQKYLQAGELIQTLNRNYELKKLDCPEFIRWVEKLPLNVPHDRKDLCSAFTNEFQIEMKPTTFYSMLRQYAEIMGYEYKEQKRQQRMHVILGQK
ncbi:hypothetical protein KJ966_22970 [bacterium]|nr:hypothetical protein [bacterium]